MSVILYNGCMRRFIQGDTVFYISLILLSLGGFFFAVALPYTEGFYGSIISSALAGIGVTGYIYYAKHYKDHLACPTGDDCNAVVNSKYSKFLGIPLEYLGMLYYSAIVLSYACLIAFPALRSSILMPTILTLTAGSFFFSMYLLFVQAFLLKRWCIWCLLSATLSTIIFIVSLISVSAASSFLLQVSESLLFIKHLGFVLGLGGATAAAFLFLRFLDDLDISTRESDVIKNMTEMIWLGLGLILISEYARYVASPEILSQSSTFLIEVVALSIAFISGAILKVLFTPFLDVLPFDDEYTSEGDVSPLVPLRKATLLTGGVAISSWYFAFFVNFLPAYNLGTYFTAYGILLFCIIIVNLSWQHHLHNTNETPA